MQMRFNILLRTFMLLTSLVCCQTVSAQGDKEFRIPKLSLYSNGSPRLAIGRRSRLQTAKSADSPFSDAIDADTPLFIFEKERGRLLVSRLQESKYLDDHGFWIDSRDCVTWSSRFFYYPKREGAIPRSFDLMWRLDGSARKWKSLENGRFFGYPRVNPLSDSPPIVLYDFGLLSGQTLASESETRDLLTVERLDNHQLYVLVTKAELNFVFNRLFEVNSTFLRARDRSFEEAVDERDKERAGYLYVNLLIPIRDAFSAMGFFDIRLFDEWIKAEEEALVKALGSGPSTKTYFAREKWRSSTDSIVDTLMRRVDLVSDDTKSDTLQHYTYQWFPDRGLEIGAFDDYVLSAEESTLWDEVEDAPDDDRRGAMLRTKNPHSSLYVDATCFGFRFDELKGVIPALSSSR